MVISSCRQQCDEMLRKSICLHARVACVHVCIMCNNINVCNTVLVCVCSMCVHSQHACYVNAMCFCIQMIFYICKSHN